MNLGDLIRPFKRLARPIGAWVNRSTELNVDEKKAADLILHLLGPASKDKETAKKIDDAISGGWLAELFARSIGEKCVKGIRRWAEKQVEAK